MKKEHDLILKSVLINKKDSEIEEIDNLLKEELCWAEIGGVLLYHRLCGYFYLGLTEKQREKIPAEMRKAIKLLVKAQKDQQLIIINELKILNEALMKTDIHYAALKGAFFTSDMYEIGARRSNDIDLLVYEEDLHKLDVYLRKLGYIQSNMPNGEMIEATKKEKLIQRMNYHDLVPYVKNTDYGVLDLDINFLFDNNKNHIDKTVYDMGTCLYEGKNYSIVSLNYYTNLAHLCAHFYREATNTIWTEDKRDITLYKTVDIINYIRYYEDKIELSKFIEVINTLNLKDKVYFSFTIIKEFYNMKFIDYVLNAIKSDDFDENLLRHIYDHKNKNIISRTESFYEKAFSCIQ